MPAPRTFENGTVKLSEGTTTVRLVEGATGPSNGELREDGTFELREDGGFELREV